MILIEFYQFPQGWLQLLFLLSPRQGGLGGQDVASEKEIGISALWERKW